MSDFESIEEELKFMADCADNHDDSEQSQMFIRYLAAFRKYQSELSALREELATVQRAKDNADLALVTQTKNKDRYKQRAVAAEQRNSELAELLEENQWRWQPYDDHDHTDAGYYCIQCYQRDKAGHAADCKLAAALKPTESRTSE